MWIKVSKKEKVREKVGTKNLNKPKGFIEYLQAIDDVYENLEDYIPTKKIAVAVWWYDFYIKIYLFLYQNLIAKCLRL